MELAAKGVTEDRLLFIWTYAVLSAALLVPVGVVWVVVADEPPRLVWFGAAAFSAAMHIGYQLTLQRGYAEGDLNLVYPLARGTGPLLTFVVAVTVLGERPGVVGGVGVALVVAGVLLISWSPRAIHANPWPGVVWGSLTGVSIAAYTVWDSHAVTDLEVPPLPYFVLNVVLQVPALTLMARRRIPQVRRAWPGLARPALVVADSRRSPTSWCWWRCSKRRSLWSPLPARAASWSVPCSAGLRSARPAGRTGWLARPSSRPGSRRSWWAEGCALWSPTVATRRLMLRFVTNRRPVRGLVPNRNDTATQAAVRDQSVTIRTR